MATDPIGTYTPVALHLDPTSKTVTTPTSSLASAVASLNAVHTSLKGVDTPSQTPPPPIPVNVKRSGHIAKLGATAAAAQRKGTLAYAAEVFGYAIAMAASRPPWPPRCGRVTSWY